MSLLNKLLEYYELLMQFQNIAYLLLPLFFTLRSQFNSQAKRPLTHEALISIVALGVSSIIQIPLIDDPKNLFILTGSRLQISFELLTKRIGAEIPEFETIYGRALYAVHGPAVYQCEWCNIDEPWTFLLYNASALLLPYVFGAFWLLVATSMTRSSIQWRRMTCVILMGILVYDAYSLYNFPLTEIKNSKQLDDIIWVYWEFSKKRGGMIVCANVVIALLIFLSDTGRLYDVGLISVEDAMGTIQALMDDNAKKLRVCNLVQDGVTLDEDTSKIYDDYYIKSRQEWKSRLEQAKEDERYHNGLLQVQGGAISKEISTLIDLTFQ